MTQTTHTPTATPDRPPLKEACVREAIEIIREKGVEQLSLRDVARRLSVSHQAPYKHFASKDVLLAEVIRRCLARFAQALGDSGNHTDAPDDAMRALGTCYLEFAAQNPLEYRLMFMTPWPDCAAELGLDQNARAGFDILARRLGALRSYPDKAALDGDAMFVWSTIHGIASILQSESMRYLAFSQEAQSEAVAHAMQMVDRALDRALDGAPS